MEQSQPIDKFIQSIADITAMVKRQGWKGRVARLTFNPEMHGLLQQYAAAGLPEPHERITQFLTGHGLPYQMNPEQTEAVRYWDHNNEEVKPE